MWPRLSCPVMNTVESPSSSSDLSTSRDLERVLFVHAHPDDESIVTGASLATLVDAGAHVTVVTCTRGELGEVIPDDLAHLRDDPEALAVHREGETAEAMRQLGVTDHRFLGSEGARTRGLPPRAYRDSGMAWGADGRPVPVPDLHPAAFCAAEFGEIVSDLAAVIADVRPDAIVSYDVDGGYGHPDHVRVNRAALRAARLAGLPFFAIGSGFVSPRAEAAATESAGGIVIDGTAVVSRKVRALEAYRTQVRVLETPTGPALEFPHGAVDPVTAVETYRLVPEPVSEPTLPATGLADYSVGGRIATYAVALVAGGLFGAIGTVSHQITVGSFPLGAILALLLVLALLAGFRLFFDSRLVGIAAAVGVVAVTALLTGPGSGGSALIPANAAGYSWTFGPTIIALIVLAWPQLPQRRAAASRVPGDKMGSSPQDR
jgi:N-acetyl-1-D-myo-inositol-2-amino-2-deoxy-alpha-D-glucopyranoside deacetylase